MLSHLLASALAALAAVAACRWWYRSTSERLLRCEAESAREHEALLLEEQELRDRLHLANEALRHRAESLQRILRRGSSAPPAS